MGECWLLATMESGARNTSIFAPASPATESIYNLSILVFAIIGLIFVIVEGVLFYSIWKFRQRPEERTSEPPQVYGSMPIEIAWTVAPALVVFFLLLVTTRTLWEARAGEPTARDGDYLSVTVVGRQWWWEYRYRDYNGRTLDFVTANELHIPVSEKGKPRPVFLQLESADVCHSFWVPRLAGKVDLIPGQVNSLWLQTESPGVFIGQCAEYCGAQHAGMLLRVVVDTPADFERWLADQQRPAASVASAAAGQQALAAQSCINCHRIRGTQAQGNYAPDLTHLMSRATLAAGLLENNEENLRAWVRDPQSIKPSCLMPAFGLPDDQARQIVDYLLTLE